MRKGFLSVLSSVVALASVATPLWADPAQPTPRPVTSINIEAQGNLGRSHDLDCSAASALKRQYTPPDLFHAVSDCLAKKHYEESVKLFAIAGAYANFDSQRVADVSAHQAGQVLILNTFQPLDAATKAEFAKALKVLTETGNPKKALLCQNARDLGPPDYWPSYMIQHGISALQGPVQSPLVPGFDPKATWERVLTSYLMCPAV